MSNLVNNIESKTINGEVYINVNKLAKSFGGADKIKNWKKSSITKNYLNNISLESEAMISTKGGFNQGTWVHEKLYENFILYLNRGKLTNKSDKLYIIQCNSFYKIGVCTDIKKRLVGLQCGNPYELNLYRLYYIKNAKKIEGEIHKKYKDKNIRLEWFDLTEEELKDIDNYIKVDNIMLPILNSY